MTTPYEQDQELHNLAENIYDKLEHGNLHGAADLLRGLQISTLREAAKEVASGKAYRHEADPLHEAAAHLEEKARALEKRCSSIRRGILI